MKRDEMNLMTPLLPIGPVVLSADNTPAAIDLVGADAATILLQVGIGGITFSGTNKIEFVVTHCDTENGTYTAVGASDVLLGTGCDASVGTGGIVKSLVAAHAAASVSKLAYIGGKRFIKILADFSGTHGAGTPIAVAVVKGQLHLSGKS